MDQEVRENLNGEKWEKNKWFLLQGLVWSAYSVLGSI